MLLGPKISASRLLLLVNCFLAFWVVHRRAGISSTEIRANWDGYTASAAIVNSALARLDRTDLVSPPQRHSGDSFSRPSSLRPPLTARSGRSGKLVEQRYVSSPPGSSVQPSPSVLPEYPRVVSVANSIPVPPAPRALSAQRALKISTPQALTQASKPSPLTQSTLGKSCSYCEQDVQMSPSTSISIAVGNIRTAADFSSDVRDRRTQAGPTGSILTAGRQLEEIGFIPLPSLLPLTSASPAPVASPSPSSTTSIDIAAGSGGANAFAVAMGAVGSALTLTLVALVAGAVFRGRATKEVPSPPPTPPSGSPPPPPPPPPPPRLSKYDDGGEEAMPPDSSAVDNRIASEPGSQDRMQGGMPGPSLDFSGIGQPGAGLGAEVAEIPASTAFNVGGSDGGYPAQTEGLNLPWLQDYEPGVRIPDSTSFGAGGAAAGAGLIGAGMASRPPQMQGAEVESQGTHSYIMEGSEEAEGQQEIETERVRPYPPALTSAEMETAGLGQTGLPGIGLPQAASVVGGAVQSVSERIAALQEDLRRRVAEVRGSTETGPEEPGPGEAPELAGESAQDAIGDAEEATAEQPASQQTESAPHPGGGDALSEPIAVPAGEPVAVPAGVSVAVPAGEPVAVPAGEHEFLTQGESVGEIEAAGNDRMSSTPGSAYNSLTKEWAPYYCQGHTGETDDDLSSKPWPQWWATRRQAMRRSASSFPERGDERVDHIYPDVTESLDASTEPYPETTSEGLYGSVRSGDSARDGAQEQEALEEAETTQVAQPATRNVLPWFWRPPREDPPSASREPAAG